MIAEDPLELAGRAGVAATDALILVDRADRLVARIETADGPAVLKAGGSFDAEVDAVVRLAGAGFPVPRVLAIRPGILVLSWTPGRALSSASSVAAQRDAGRILRRLHAMPAGPWPGAVTWIAGWLHAIADWWPGAGGTAAQVADLWARYRSLEPLLAARSGGLILHDGRPEHFLVDDTRVVGLIDLHDVGPGDAAMDLAVLGLADPGLLPAVLDGYRPTAGERAAFDVLVPFFTVMRALAAAEWHQRTGAPELAGPMLERAVQELARQDV